MKLNIMDSGNYREPNLKILFAKLGHSLEEIRVRALQNIISKLEYGLVSNSDLVHERHLHIRLLEWFNFASCPMLDRVLGLILQLSQHSAAAQIYLEVGAVEFLSQLRPNLDSGLHKVVDAILDNLFHLPTTDPGVHAAECIYLQRATGNFNGGLVGDCSGTQDTSTPFSYQFALSDSVGSNKYASQMDSNAGGYFGAEHGNSGLVPQSALVVSAKCLKFSTFPWISLTPTDRHVLASTDESVRSKDMSMIVSVCEFLTDVVMQDFPAEVFLQRPNITKNLLSLLSVTNRDNILLLVIRTFRDLTFNLLSRINYFQDPCFYATKQDFTAPSGSENCSMTQGSESLNGSDDMAQATFIGQARHRGDGQDVDTSSSSTQSFSASVNGGSADLIEQTDLEDVYSLQFVQWSVPQFCLQLLDKLVPCLHGPVEERLALHGIELLHLVAALLRESVMASALWDDNSMPARELVDKFHDVLESIGKVLCSHHHGNISSLIGDADLERHRVLFIGVAIFTVDLLRSLVPLETASVAISKEFGSILATVCLDRAFADAYPDCVATALEYLRLLDTDSIVAYNRINDICRSLISSCNFLTKFGELSDDNVPVLLQLANDSLPSLRYHVSLDLVDACVVMSSYICKKTSPSPNAVRESRDILLALLSHEVNCVRSRAHDKVFCIVSDALGIEHTVEPTSAATLSAMFIVDAKIFYHFCAFSVVDKPEIKEVTEKILLYILKSQLLMSAARWQHVLDALSVVLAALQSRCNMDSALGKCIMGMLETDPRIDTGVLSLLERLRSCLRVMMHSDPRVRVAGAERVLKFIAQEKSSSRKLPVLSDFDIRSMTDLFIVKNARALSDDATNSMFQSADVKKVYDIFIDDSVELAVRKSACEQLAVIIADTNLQSAFIQFGGFNTVLNTLKCAVEIPADATIQRNPLTTLLPGVVKIIRCIVEKNTSLRHQLAHEIEIYYSVLRSTIIHQRDDEMRQNASELIALLVFDEMATLKEWNCTEKVSTLLSLPACIVDRYHLPFATAIHHRQSPWKEAVNQLDETPFSDTLLETLRIVWNVAWHDGIEPAIVSRDVSSESKSLALTHVDRIICSMTHVPYALKQSVYAINNATSHQDVSRALVRLRLHLVAGSSYNVIEHLYEVKWKEAITRFLHVAPSTSADEQLLSDVIHFLDVVVMQSSTDTSVAVFNWIADAMLNTKGAMYQLLTKQTTNPDKEGSDEAQNIRRQFNRSMLKFIRLFVGRYPYYLVHEGISSRNDGAGRCVHGDLARSILMKINRVDSIQSYNLPSLEMTLLALMHITARRGWSVNCSSADCLTLCLEMLQTLLEVVSAFHAGRGGLSMSYMGRGITRCAAICLRHLAHEMSTRLHSQEWPRNWLFAKHAVTDSVGESGLHWLFPLWFYRDIEVHIAGISIAAALTSTEAGRITMATQCHNVPGGIWGAALNLLLDPSECSLARQQAALLLVNLTSQAMPSEVDAQSTAAVWQGPVVRNEETGVSLFGLEALLVLLRHLQFYDKIKTLLSFVYVQPAVRRVCTMSQFCAQTSSTTISSQNTALTLGFAAPHIPTGILVDLGTSSQLMSTSTDERSSSSPWRQQSRMLSLFGQVDTGEEGTENSRRRHVTGEGHNGNSSSTVGHPASNRQLGNLSVSQSSSATESTVAASTETVNSIVTPCLVSSVCCLLTNIIALSPNDAASFIRVHSVFTELLNLLDSRLLRAYVTDLASTEYRAQFLMTFFDLVLMHRDVIDLIGYCSACDNEVRGELLANTAAIKEIILLLGISFHDDPDTSNACTSLWKSCLTLLSNLLMTAGQDAYIALSHTITKQWKVLSACLIHIIQDKSYVQTDLWLTALNLIGLLFSEESKLKGRLAVDQNADIAFVASQLDYLQIASDDVDVSSEQLAAVTSGSLLCRALVGAIDAVLTKPPEQFFVMKAAVVNAMKSLLAVSSTAKSAALEVGLFETLCDHVRHVHNQLNMEALNLTKSSAVGKKKVNPTISELMMTFDLIRNFLFNSEEVKSYASKSQLASLIHCVWYWCQTDVALMSCTLGLLCTYTAHCSAACSSLAFTSSSSLGMHDHVTSLPVNKHSSNSLVHCLIRLVQKETSNPSSHASSASILRLAFSLLSTLTISSECRGILWKSNFLHEFSSLSPHKAKKSKSGCHVDSLWLALFVNLSFSVEGQGMILKIEDSLSLLIDYCGYESHESSALLVLRNLCFHAANKPKLIANDTLVPVLLRNVESGSSVTQSIACSAILALVYNNQKAKGLLKNASTMCKLRDAYNRCINLASSGDSSLNDCARVIQDVLILLRA